MSVLFVETSALVKRYVPEAGSTWLKALVAPTSGNMVTVSAITQVEAVSAVGRRSLGGSLSAEDAESIIASVSGHFLHEYDVIEVSRSVIDIAVHIANEHALRGYDAVQLATALEVDELRKFFGEETLTLISADASLNTAAEARGLSVENPNDRP